MGLLASRLNFSVSLHPGRNRNQRSHQDDASYNYSFSKNSFSNYFFMGGERFEINEPGYVFGDNFDLNFLGCTKPHHFPYKKAKQSLLSNLHNNNSKQCSDISSGRVNSSSLIKILPRCRHKRDRNGSNNSNNGNNSNSNNKRDAQTQTTNGTNNNTGSKGYGMEPSRPIEMLINIRKETLRLIRSSPSNLNQSESDLDSIAIDMEPQSGEKTELESETDKKEQQPDGNHHDELKPPIFQQQQGEDEASSQPGSKGDKCEVDSKKEDEVELFIIEENRKKKSQPMNPVYNIEFNFDCEVDCSVRIFYLCTREVSPNGINYKPQHATYKSKVYHYERGLNQKFDQRDHTFQPFLFDEDLLAYKPTDIDGNYNSKAVYPIVIHCSAIDGPNPRQSQSLIATIEKSQTDESYTIKPLKQLIFADGIQFILQDIYGAENKDLLCVICMSDGRDTMLLPCRHMCLCSPCAQSLTHQANSCPICRRSFKAALNLRSEIKDDQYNMQYLSI